jgi:hypothetical protein
MGLDKRCRDLRLASFKIARKKKEGLYRVSKFAKAKSERWRPSKARVEWSLVNRQAASHCVSDEKNCRKSENPRDQVALARKNHALKEMTRLLRASEFATAAKGSSEAREETAM